MRGLLARELLVESLVGSRMANRVLLEEHQPLQIYLLHAGFGSDADEVGQLRDGLTQPRQPCRDARLIVPLPLLQVAEGTHILQDAIEEVLAPDRTVGLGIGRIKGNAQLVETRFDKRAAVTQVEHGTVSVEQYVSATVFEMPHHPRQLLDQHWLSHPVQHCARKVWNLIDDGDEQLPAYVCRRLELRIGPRASRAEQIAAVGGLQIKAHRRVLGRLVATMHALEITPRIDAGFC